MSRYFATEINPKSLAYATLVDEDTLIARKVTKGLYDNLMLIGDKPTNMQKDGSVRERRLSWNITLPYLVAVLKDQKIHIWFNDYYIRYWRHSLWHLYIFKDVLYLRLSATSCAYSYLDSMVHDTCEVIEKCTKRQFLLKIVD